MINKKNIQNLITNKSNTKEQIEKKNLKKKNLTQVIILNLELGYEVRITLYKFF
jgi:hypothetical protein